MNSEGFLSLSANMSEFYIFSLYSNRYMCMKDSLFLSQIQSDLLNCFELDLHLQQKIVPLRQFLGTRHYISSYNDPNINHTKAGFILE